MTEQSAAIPRYLGPYRIERQIGSGQMGTVYAAIHTRLDRPVALKVLHPATLEMPHCAGQLVREARSIARLEHPNIVAIYDAGEIDGISYIAMKLLDGENLQTILDGPPSAPGSIPLGRVIRITAQLAQALDYAHTREVVHLDVKPANVMVARGDHVTLTDFGIARSPLAGATQATMVTGTPRYMSPEQCLGQPVDCRSDIYSLGLLMYHMCAGHTPYQGRPTAVMYAQVHVPVPDIRRIRPDIPEVLAVLIHRALAKNPAERFQTAAEFYRALERAAEAAGEPLASGAIALSHHRLGSAAGEANRSSPATSGHMLSLPPADVTVALRPPAVEQMSDPGRWWGRMFHPSTPTHKRPSLTSQGRLVAGSASALLAATLAAIVIPPRFEVSPARASSPPLLTLSVTGLHQRGLYLSGQQVTLRWSKAAGAQIYRLQLAGRSSDTTVSGAFRHPLQTDLVDGRTKTIPVVGRQVYSWRVQAEVNGKWAAYTPPRHFTVAEPTVGRPLLRTPANGTSRITRQMRLCWSQVNGAVTYRIQVSGLRPITRRGTCLSLPLRPHQYSWIVTALVQGARLYAGRPSVRWQFTVAPQPTPLPATPLPTAALTLPPTPLPTARPQQGGQPGIDHQIQATPQPSRVVSGSAETLRPTAIPMHPVLTPRPAPSATPCDPELDPC